MRLNSKVTWGLAWTGLAVVLAVPSADFLTGHFGTGKDAAVLTSTVDAVKTASVAPAVTTVKTKNGISIVPAGGKLPAADPLAGNGKALPDYISDGKAPAKIETQVASIDPTPPTPFPFWARPKGVAPVVSAPTVTAPVLTSPTVAPPTVAAQPDPVVVVDDTTLTGSIAEPAAPVPPTALVDDSSNWDNESLRQYLERRGILGDASNERSSATVTEHDSNYDPNGFYLNDGPNAGQPGRTDRETRRQRVLRMLQDEDPQSFTLF